MNMNRFVSPVSRLLALATLGLTMATPALAMGLEAREGVLVGSNGMTLYTFDRDQAGTGKSVCNGPCAANWPPVPAAAAPATGDWSHLTRDDGSQQLAYKGKPLYFWVKDQKPGDKTGEGVNNVWRLARP